MSLITLGSRAPVSSRSRLVVASAAALAIPLLVAGPAEATSHTGVSTMATSVGARHVSPGFGRALPTSTSGLPQKGTVFLADYLHNRVVSVAPDGTETTVMSGFAPYGVAVDRDGNVFATDMAGGSVVEWSPDGTRTSVATGLDSPVGVAVDDHGDLFVSGGSGATAYVMEITPDGTRTPVGFAQLKHPLGVAVDGTGDVFVADPMALAVFELTPNGVETTVAGDLGFPSGVAVDRGGQVFISDQLDGGGILEVAPDGTRTHRAMTGLGSPDGVATDFAGNAYVVSNGTDGVYRLAPDGHQTTVAPDVQGYGAAVYDWSPQRISFVQTPFRPKMGHTYHVWATGGGSGEPVRLSTDPSSTGCTVDGDGTVTTTHAGRCVIDATQAGGGDFSAAPQALERFAVARGGQKVTFTKRAPRRVRVGAVYRPSATGGASGHPVRFLVRGACVLRGGVVRFDHAGLCVVLARQAGSRDWLVGSAKESIWVLTRS